MTSPDIPRVVKQLATSACTAFFTQFNKLSNSAIAIDHINYPFLPTTGYILRRWITDKCTFLQLQGKPFNATIRRKSKWADHKKNQQEEGELF